MKCPFKKMLCLALFSLVAGVACGDADDDNNGEEGSEYEIPEGMSDYLSDEEIGQFTDNGFELNDGDEPPNIEGSYSAADSTFTYDSSGQDTGDDVYEYIWAFENQTDEQMDVSYESQGSDDEASGLGGFIAGEGDCFTVAAEVTGVDGDGCDFIRVHLVSGCISDAGIEDFATGITGWEPGGGPEADEEACEPSDEKAYQIAVEQDGLADRVDEN